MTKDFRGDFPLLNHTMNGKPLVYLDSANTGQKPAPKPTPFTTPRREGQALNEETAEVIKSPDLDNRAG